MAEGISGLENFFKALSDATRLKILFALYDAGELCVCDLGEIAGVSLASASHHIRLLFQAGLVRYEKRGNSFIMLWMTAMFLPCWSRP